MWKNASKYKVINAPVGAIVIDFSEVSEEKAIDGYKYMICNKVYYQPISKAGQNSYVVVEGN